jgi:hypothetical protein
MSDASCTDSIAGPVGLDRVGLRRRSVTAKIFCLRAWKSRHRSTPSKHRIGSVDMVPNRRGGLAWQNMIS